MNPLATKSYHPGSFVSCKSHPIDYQACHKSTRDNAPSFSQKHQKWHKLHIMLQVFIRVNLLLQGSNVRLLDEQTLLLHYEQWPAAATIVCIQPQLLQTNISDHPNFCIHIHLMMQASNKNQKVIDIVELTFLKTYPANHKVNLASFSNQRRGPVLISNVNKHSLASRM